MSLECPFVFLKNLHSVNPPDPPLGLTAVFGVGGGPAAWTVWPVTMDSIFAAGENNSAFQDWSYMRNRERFKPANSSAVPVKDGGISILDVTVPENKYPAT